MLDKNAFGVGVAASGTRHAAQNFRAAPPVAASKHHAAAAATDASVNRGYP
ncbi:hypothetical protein [Mycobacterium sp.]|uniref:hypothetical protein n=1 Tax=Mycobacterium sp. TaxID=1785 RepID=UPI002C455D83|nr:hypothetical protein [Mycobacterium sp.]HTQ20291.1 hypothetical protein [Mycobacterium sp.]